MTCARFATAALRARSSAARCTRGGSPCPRRCSAAAPDARAGAAPRRRVRGVAASVLEPRHVPPGRRRWAAARAARRVAQHGRPRRVLARGARLRPGPRQGGGGGGGSLGLGARGRAGAVARGGGGGGRRIASREVALPDSGTVSTDVTFPVSRIPSPGWSALVVRLEGVPSDSEPRDDARLFVLEVSPQPSVVVLAAPPDWDTRFLARTLQDVARVPVRSFVKVEPRSEAWRDAATLAPVPGSQVAQAVGAAQLVARVGDAAALARF